MATVTDDPETIAAAWLHDTVEDTPVTLEDVREAFGEGVAQLVSELTDVSRPSDGNRAARKAIDRRHLAAASPRAKTVKLADLTDNCRDICRHAPRFARVYLEEMAALLEVLGEGDARLHAQARRTWERCRERLGLPAVPPAPAPDPASEVDRGRLGRTLYRGGRALRLFAAAFTSADLAEPLASFDRAQGAEAVRAAMEEGHIPVAGAREGGRVQGYLLAEDLRGEEPELPLRTFRRDQVVEGGAPLADVIEVLTRCDHCFVEAFGEVAGVVTRSDVQKPVVRMWLFGVITMAEIAFTHRIRAVFPDGGWRALLSESRLKRAEELRRERERRGQTAALLDCLQLSDKGAILLNDEELFRLFEFPSQSAAQRVLRELESLRNHLAHAQDIVTHDWPAIVRLARHVAELAAGQFRP